MQLERRGDVAILRINEGKANAIGGAWLTSMHEALDGLDDARALVMTGYDTFFSAGLDLPTLIDLKEPDLRAFIGRFSATMIRIFTLDIPVVAAVNGHAIAGGCVLMMQADVRFAVDEGAKIGLYEVMLGIGLPAAVFETMRCQVSASALVPIALEGRLFTPTEARAIGLVDELAARDSLLDRALDRARAMSALPRVAFADIKRSMRAPAIEAVKRTEQTDAAKWTATWFSPEGQERLRAAAAKLKR